MKSRAEGSDPPAIGIPRLSLIHRFGNQKLGKGRIFANPALPVPFPRLLDDQSTHLTPGHPDQLRQHCIEEYRARDATFQQPDDL